jgi:probable FeS assembly SUF system protein SufT
MHMFGGGQESTLTRDCKGVQIPEGTPTILEKGHLVYITQVLGGMFTVETEFGYLVRIDGKDADALGQEVPPERRTIEFSEHKSLEETVWAQLRTCYDPEIPVNIVELGLVYECKVSPLEEGGNRADIQMTLTAPGCGMGEILKSDVETKLLDIPGITTASVEVVFDPPWESGMMSEAARLQLGMM